MNSDVNSKIKKKTKSLLRLKQTDVLQNKAMLPNRPINHPSLFMALPFVEEEASV
jgi:hypothetical protein